MSLGLSGVSSIVGVMVLLSAMPMAAAEERCVPPAVRIVSLQGRVEIQPADQSEWRAASLEESVCVGDVIRVGPLARAALALADDSVLRLDERTMLRVEQVAVDEPTLLDLFFGAVNFFSRQPRVLQVNTPYVNGGAEGTEFLVRVTDDRTLITLFEGRVRASNALGELVLGPGESALTVAGQAPRAEIVARPRDAVAWALYYPPVLPPLAERSMGELPLPPGVRAALDAVALNDYAGAIEALDAMPEAARDARYFTYRAGVLLNVGRVEAASAAIEQALALDPEAGEALAERAIIRVVQNRREEALADARRAVELSPDSAAAQVALSYALQAQFQLEEAREVLREATLRLPDDALLQARLAEIELSFGELDRAEEAAERAVALAPDLARTQMVLGFANLTRIEIEGAKAAFRRAIELDSAEPLARLGLGLAIIRGGDLKAGGREIEIAAGLDPNDSLIRSYLGKTYFEERRDPLAADQYAIAKELDPNDPTPWFYDAVRLQLDNRPVEALRNLERSIALNDNRAVYRSRLLLDEDIAVRETSLARIYDDLGFEQRALVEATKSLEADPANYSAHRFLSDAYSRVPRHEIARASELLQAQLLQPININPVQPSAALTDLNVVAGQGPAEAAFDEFTPLFARNDAQLTAMGLLGNNDTRAGEAALSMVNDRMSLSVGGLVSDTDGFRENADLDNDVFNAFGQVAVTPQINVQSEYRYRKTDQGDISLDFEPEDFSSDDRRDIEQETIRVGGRWSPLPAVNVLISAIYSDRDGHQELALFPSIDEDLSENGYQLESQALYRHPRFNVIVGGGLYDIDVKERSTLDFNPIPCPIPTGCTFDDDFSRQQQNVYSYTNIEWPTAVTWTVGVSYDHYDQRDLDHSEFNPKLGIQWDVTERIRLRAAAFETIKRDLIVSQTIEPTQIAGFNQFFDDLNGTTAKSYGLGLDVRPTADLYGGVEATWRKLDSPTFVDSSVQRDDRDEQLYRGYLYWTPHVRWALSAEVAFDRFSSDGEPNVDIPSQVDTFTVPLAVRYFDPSGFFAELGGAYVYQDVNRPPGASLADGHDGFVLVDAAIGYRLPKRRGIVSLEATNLLDNGFQFQDENYRTNEPRTSRYIPERTILGRLTLSF